MSEIKPLKQNLLDRVISVIAPMQAVRRMAAKQLLHEFAYDAVQSSTKRAQAPAQIAPNSFQVQRDRLQLMREAIDLENNFAPAKTLNRKYAMYVTPQSYHAQTGDADLNLAVERYLNDEWFPNCDVSGRHHFFQMLEFGVMGMNRGGDYGWAFIRPGIESDMPTESIIHLPLRIQAVESDRIGGVYQNVVSENYVSGIGIGESGTIEYYRVFRRGMSAGQYFDPVDVPANQFVHYVDAMQADMYRGVSKLDAGCAHLRDLYEMVDYLKGKAKLASALTIFTNTMGATSGSGAMDAYSSNKFERNAGALQQDIYYGQINHLTAGADIKFPDTNSPGPENQFLMTMLLKMVCMSYNLPYSFGLDAQALGGVSSRLESEQARAEFERGQKVLAPRANRIKDAALFDAIAKGKLPASASGIITRGRWGYRAHPQPDIGKQANADIGLYQSGLRNPMQFWVDNSADPEDVAMDFVRWHDIKVRAASQRGYDVTDVFGVGPAKPLNISTNTSESTSKSTSESVVEEPGEESEEFAVATDDGEIKASPES